MVLAQRINMILKASLGNLLDRAENPEKMLGLYRRELEQVIEEIQSRRHGIEAEIDRLEAGAPTDPGVHEEILALKVRESELAESMAALSEKLGRVQGCMMISRERKRTGEAQQTDKAAQPFPDSREFDRAVERFEKRSHRLERQFLELESA